MRVFLVGYPGELGGANTEAWHTIKLWRRFDVDVHLIPTWGTMCCGANDWGWREMIEHGVTGFLGSDDCELAHYAAMLAHDEPLRLHIIHAARERLVTELANPTASGPPGSDCLSP